MHAKAFIGVAYQLIIRDSQAVMDFPKTRDAAKQHIEKIRVERGLYRSDINTADLEAALVMLSEQLYRKSTHFLLELIQNVDDNTYDNPFPTLNIAYKHRRLHISCNEVGFNKRNVEALCSIGQSTKSGLDYINQFIGEKGIGFKSLFKVADVVWINSGKYSFKFDKRGKLGMITPIWADFPAKHATELTSFILQLSTEYDETELIREIKLFDPALLVFLRKLRQINVSVFEHEGGSWQTVLARHDEQSWSNDQQLMKLGQDGMFLRYIITRYPVHYLPAEPKRPGCQQSEILLAFPVPVIGSDAAEINSQHVYAFLPIRDYGFKFLLQSDFILTASREDIDRSSVWNQALHDSVPAALLKAISSFNEGKLRYSWLRYLPIRPPIIDFFEQLETITLQLLSREPILECASGKLTVPCRLTYVPDMFLDEDGMPLTLCESTLSKYLSHRYSSNDWPKLRWLGVHELSHDNFLEDLGLFISQHGNEYQQKAPQWHSHLAIKLASLLSTRSTNLSFVSKLKLVPLCNGQWVSPSSENLGFPNNEGAPTVPNGIDIMEVHPHASKDLHRRNLLNMLGVKSFDSERICDIIIEVHSKPRFNPRALSPADLITHALFLYLADWVGPPGSDLWFVAENGTCVLGSQLYIDSGDAHAATKYFAAHRTKFPFLHNDYFQFGSIQKERLSDWLVKNLNLHYLPRLVSQSVNSSFLLSEEFEFLFDTFPSSQILLLLRSHWPHYSKWIEGNAGVVEDIGSDTSADSTSPNPELVKRLSSVKVRCRDGTFVRLDQTFLPSGKIPFEDLPTIPFLDVPDPDKDSWIYLTHFGVTAKLGVESFIHFLRILQTGQHSLERVSKFYSQILKHAYTELDTTSDFFAKEPLIYIPPEAHERDGTWVCSTQCVWNGHGCLQKTPCLSRYYPGLSFFFCGILQVQNGDINTLIGEAYQITGSDELSYISKLFLAIASELEERNEKLGKDTVQKFCQQWIFPVRDVISQSTYEYSLQRAHDSDIWFIADQRNLMEAFEGMAPLLSFSVEDVTKMTYLIKELGLESRLLSVTVTALPELDGPPKLHDEYTELLRRKARFISRLVPKKTSLSRSMIVELLQSVKVNQVNKVFVRWSAALPRGEAVKGHLDSGRVKLAVENSQLQLYLAKNVNPSCPPLELVQELAKFCEIHNPEKITILQHILMQPDIDEIKYALERSGIPDDIPDPEMVLENHRYRINPNSKYQGKNDAETLRHFLHDIELVGSIKNITSRRWELNDSTDSSRLISRICKLENQDVSMFLPQDYVNFLDKVHSTADSQPNQYYFASRGEITEQEVTDRTTLVFPARYIVTKTGRAETRVFDKPVNALDEEVLFFGEFFISRLFENNLNEAYSPATQWTSRLRNRAGLAPYKITAKSTSTFTIKDITGAFRKFLGRNGYKKAARWRNNPTFHIEVITTEEELECSRFHLDANQVEKAEKFRITEASSVPPTEVFILIRVFNIRSSPAAAIFVDPWNMHLRGQLRLFNFAHYFAEFAENAPHIILQDLADKSLTSGCRIQRSLDRVLRKPKGQGGAHHLCPSSKGQYRYRPLSGFREFRLLKLSAGIEEMPLEGVIQHCSLDSPGQYKALSYCWGSHIKPFKLNTPEGTLSLTTPLYTAIRRMREPQDSILIWADAICIDQSNNDEKAIQIRLMQSIFQLSECVYAWIGDERDKSDQAIETLMQICTLAVNRDVWPKNLRPVPTSWAGKKIPCDNDPIWDAIENLLRRDWFSRVWVVQELVLASKVILLCGAWSVNWDDIFAALKIYMTETHAKWQSNSFNLGFVHPASAAYVLGLTRKTYNNVPIRRRHKLLALFELFSYTKATLEHDRLFALLGLASDADEVALNPDYKASFEIIVRRFAGVFVSRGVTMELLYRAGTSKAYEFASWIPHWTRNDYPRTISTWGGVRGTFNASGETSARVFYSPVNENILVVHGFLFDSIIELGDIAFGEDNIVRFINSICASIKTLKAYPTGETIEELMHTLPIGDAKRPHQDTARAILSTINVLTYSEETQKNEFSFDRITMEHPTIQAFIDSWKRPHYSQGNMFKYWDTVAAFSKRISNGRFCASKRGFAGLVPHQAKVGDQICIFHGGAVPFVLRKNKAQENCYSLIGECYIHGIMYGEALKSYSTEAEGIRLL